jgi:hypothetical protein
MKSLLRILVAGLLAFVFAGAHAGIIVASEMYSPTSFKITWLWDEGDPATRKIGTGMFDDNGAEITQEVFEFIFG